MRALSSKTSINHTQCNRDLWITHYSVVLGLAAYNMVGYRGCLYSWRNNFFIGIHVSSVGLNARRHVTCFAHRYFTTSVVWHLLLETFDLEHPSLVGYMIN